MLLLVVVVVVLLVVLAVVVVCELLDGSEGDGVGFEGVLLVVVVDVEEVFDSLPSSAPKRLLLETALFAGAILRIGLVTSVVTSDLFFFIFFIRAIEM